MYMSKFMHIVWESFNIEWNGNLNREREIIKEDVMFTFAGHFICDIWRREKSEMALKAFCWTKWQRVSYIFLTEKI